MSGTDEPSSYDRCLDELDRTQAQLSRGALTPSQWEAKTIEALQTYFDDDRPDDDIDFLIEYARIPLDARAGDPLHGDRAAASEFDRRIRHLLHLPVARVDLAIQLDAIRAAAVRSRSDAIESLRELCATGWRDQPRVFMFRESAERTLDLAAEIGAVPALVDAVTPALPTGGQLGHRDMFDGFTRRRVFDLLAQMAAGPGAAGHAARDALVELCGYAETAPMAVVRLPVHLLSADHRSALMAHLGAFEELLTNDPLFAPAADADRLPDALRSALWLANDAAHIG